MGQYADDAIQAGLDEAWNSFRGPHRMRRQPLKICKHCGEGGLRWYKDRRFWILVKDVILPNGAKDWIRHNCKVLHKRKFK